MAPSDVNKVPGLPFCHSDGGTAGAPPQTSASRCHRPCQRQQLCHQPRWEQGFLAAVCSPGPTGCRLTPGSQPSLQPSIPPSSRTPARTLHCSDSYLLPQSSGLKTISFLFSSLMAAIFSILYLEFSLAQLECIQLLRPDQNKVSLYVNGR